MKIKLKRPWGEDIGYYSSVLDKYKISYGLDCVDIEINSIEELFTLSKELDKDLIVSSYGDNQVTIYDTYLE